jgi:hypothetical protein
VALKAYTTFYSASNFERNEINHIFIYGYSNSSVDLQSSNSTSLYKSYSINKLSQKDSGYA